MWKASPIIQLLNYRLFNGCPNGYFIRTYRDESATVRPSIAWTVFFQVIHCLSKMLNLNSL